MSQVSIIMLSTNIVDRLNRDINKAKAEFGIHAYEAVIAGDLSTAQKVRSSITRNIMQHYFLDWTSHICFLTD